MRLIDADELREGWLEWDIYDEIEANTVLYSIDDQPTINPEDLRPKGKWIEKPYLLGTSRFCSLCGENYGMPHGIYNYCPNCGSRMEAD